MISQDEFTDVYGFDPEVRTSFVLSMLMLAADLTGNVQLLGMVPQPVKAVVLLFPISEAYEKARKEEDAKIAKDGQHPIDPTILWIKQTVRICDILLE